MFLLGGGEERLKNVICLFLKFLMVKADLLNDGSHNVPAYKNIATTLDEDLLYYFYNI
jgi:hypothetical protein